MAAKVDASVVKEAAAKAVLKKNIFGTVICVENGKNTISHTSSAGNLTAETPYFIASVTKLYVTACLLKLRAENKLQLHDSISNYISDDVLHQLHIYNGKDYSKEITIKHLLSNTSGIPDYFSADVINQLTAGKDQSWGFARTISTARKKKPKFAPGKRAQYSDTNFQLLGKIIETITEQDIHSVFKQYIFNELELKDTYLYEDVNDKRPAPLYYKNRTLRLPKYMASIGPEGGIVSTAKESMIFLKAFINGHFFPKETFDELQDWKIIFNPGLFFYGVGIERQPLSIRDLNNGLIGHWGQTGAFSFYHSKTDLYFTGTTNQFFGQRAAAAIIIQIIKQAKQP